MKIAVPSYKRANILKTKTLPLLKSYGIRDDEIDVFVGDKDEYEEYISVIGTDINIIVGLVGIKNIREFMSCHYEEGEEILYMDDDVEALEERVEIDGKKRLKPITDLRSLVKEGFELCRKHQAQNWGIYPCRNAFYMPKDRVFTDLKYIIGAFTGVINDTECERRSVSHGEDYERTIRYYLKYNSLVRFNHITLKTKYFAEGGIDAEYNGKRSEHITSEIMRLKDRYPEMMYLKKKAKYLNPVLKDGRESQVCEFLDYE